MAIKSSSVCALEPEKLTKTKWIQYFGTPCISKHWFFGSAITTKKNNPNFASSGCFGILRTSFWWWAQIFLKLVQPGMWNWQKRKSTSYWCQLYSDPQVTYSDPEVIHMCPLLLVTFGDLYVTYACLLLCIKWVVPLSILIYKVCEVIMSDNDCANSLSKIMTPRTHYLR